MKSIQRDRRDSAGGQRRTLAPDAPPSAPPSAWQILHPAFPLSQASHLSHACALTRTCPHMHTEVLRMVSVCVSLCLRLCLSHSLSPSLLFSVSHSFPFTLCSSFPSHEKTGLFLSHTHPIILSLTLSLAHTHSLCFPQHMQDGAVGPLQVSKSVWERASAVDTLRLHLCTTALSEPAWESQADPDPVPRAY